MRPDIILAVGSRIGPELEALTIDEVAITLGALAKQALRDCPPEMTEAWFDIFLSAALPDRG